jgi:hypothetical protein
MIDDRGNSADGAVKTECGSPVEFSGGEWIDISARGWNYGALECCARGGVPLPIANEINDGLRARLPTQSAAEGDCLFAVQRRTTRQIVHRAVLIAGRKRDAAEELVRNDGSVHMPGYPAI